jgi:hypothetical protein
MNAHNRILEKTSRERYKKVGNKYVLCNDVDAYEGLEEGWWLVWVRDGCKSMRQMVYPQNSEAEALIRENADKILKILIEATAPKHGVELNAEAKKDWEELVAKHGKAFASVYFPSINDVAESIIAKLINK